MDELDVNVVSYLESLGFVCYRTRERIVIYGLSDERKKAILRGVARNGL